MNNTVNSLFTRQGKAFYIGSFPHEFKPIRPIQWFFSKWSFLLQEEVTEMNITSLGNSPFPQRPFQRQVIKDLTKLIDSGPVGSPNVSRLSNSCWETAIDAGDRQ